MNNSENSLLFSYEGFTAVLTLNREKVLNAIDLEMAEALKSSLAEAEANPGIRAVILTGKGRAFAPEGICSLRWGLTLKLRETHFWR